MIQAPAIIVSVYQTLRKKAHTLSRSHIELHICLKYPYLNNPITLSTHPKQQQQAQHQLIQQASQKQNKALTAMIMTTGYPGKPVSGRGKNRTAPRIVSTNNEKE
jgi:hypothetical protein